MKKPRPNLPLKAGDSMDRLYQTLGVSLIIAGVLLNEWVINFLSTEQVTFAEIEKRVFLVTVEIVLVLLGLLVFRYKKVALQNLLLIFCSIFFTFGILEIGLKYVPSNLEKEAPLWIPYEQKMMNARINQIHNARSKLNRYGFNDQEHALRKTPGITRIAVLGDSFIWGAGVEERVIWTNKLARLLKQNGVKSEVLNWGKSGWSTLHEYRFLKSDGIHYDFDLLLVGFGANDPVMDDSQVKSFIYSGGIIDRLLVQPISRYLFPNAMSLSVDLVNGFFNSFFDYGYPQWLNKVYTEENLKKYQALLKDMSEYCRSRNIRLLFVMTPENHHPLLQQRFEKIIPLLKNANIDYLNLYPAIYQELRDFPNRKLWANPADGHPGDRVTDVYARHVYQYLLKQGYLKPSGAIKK
jgi:lysophospholipase L1-like esterase